MSNGPVIRVLLADEHSLFREAMRIALETAADMHVEAEAKNGDDAVAEAERTRPQLALIDSALKDVDGIQTTRMIRDGVPSCQVLVLSSEPDERTLARAIEAGANGYLTKAAPLSELLRAARAIADGETVIPKEMLGPLLATLIGGRNQRERAFERVNRLTRREREVLSLLADGADNHAIAATLVISPQTARTHIQNVLTKLGVHSRLEAAAFARDRRMLIEPSRS
ncbi:MAG: response regulator [Actinomycetota bacterium]